MKNTARKTKQPQNYNVLTGNVGHPEIAKNIIEGILLDADYKETTLDCLMMLIEAFASQDHLVKVKDLADDLQDYLFTQTSDCNDATRRYIEKIKAGKEYKTKYLHLIAG